MNKRELQERRRPFVRALFQKNTFNLAMTLAAALLSAVGELVISWLIKAVSDLISGDCPYSIGTLLIIAGGTLALFAALILSLIWYYSKKKT